MTGNEAHGFPGSDDLRAISGIGPRVAAALEELGIRTFADLAGCKPEQLSSRLRESGLRISPKVIRSANWIGQARNRARRQAGRAEPSPPEEPPAVAEEGPAPAPVEPELAPALAKAPAPAAGAAGRLDDVEIAVGALPAPLAHGSRPLLEATVTFTPRGVFEPPDDAEAVAARVRVFAVPREGDGRRLIGFDEVPLEPGERPCAMRLPFECPPRGRYRFEATVQVRDARRPVAATASQDVRIAA
jgi:hypothetical protein